MKFLGYALLALAGFGMMSNYLHHFWKKPPHKPDPNSADGTAFHGDGT